MFYVYIITNKPKGTLNIGQSDDIVKPMWEHKQKTRSGFASQYNLTHLVWFESFETREAAFVTERRMKKWNRLWKINIIEARNPNGDDLTETLSIIR
jgi:putative endonuclease